jgi:hypothetical protein
MDQTLPAGPFPEDKTWWMLGAARRSVGTTAIVGSASASASACAVGLDLAIHHRDPVSQLVVSGAGMWMVEPKTEEIFAGSGVGAVAIERWWRGEPKGSTNALGTLLRVVGCSR